MSEYRRMQAYKAGKKAHADGKPHTANNRERGTIFYDDWADGWIEANGGVVPMREQAA
jgi:hypothetical protein